MARICLYPLFVLLIVFALRLDFNEAAFPPPGYITRCLVTVEAQKVNGIYRYDPDEEVSGGYPKMVKLDITPGQPIDYNRVVEGYNFRYWSRNDLGAIRFSYRQLKMAYNVIHPCDGAAGDDTIRKLFKDTAELQSKGFAQRTNELVQFECLPLHGALQLKRTRKYDLPVYSNMKTAYECVTWLREVEATSGVMSNATAAQVNPNTKTCTLFYRDHGDFNEIPGNNNYCFLDETESPGDYPGFYTVCRIYVEDPVFAGLWELYYKRHSYNMPYMRMRLAELKEGSTEVLLRNGFKPGYKARLNRPERKFQFLLDGAVGLEFDMTVHFCIGPDTGQIAKTTTEQQVSVVYRKDEEMNCVPFYGVWSFDYGFEGTISVTLDVYHTLSSCREYFKTNYPAAEWKVTESTIDVGPCVGYGGGITFAAGLRENGESTYSCISTQYSSYYEVYPDCQYALDAGIYSGLYIADTSFTNNYTHYPTFTRSGDEDGTSVLMIWEDGYKVKGLGEVWQVGLQDSVCSPDRDYGLDGGDSGLVTRNGEVVGRAGQVPDNKPYDPQQQSLGVDYYNPGYTSFQIDDVWVLADCIAAAENHQKVGWKAFMRTQSGCKAWGERIDMTKVTVFQSVSSSIYSYVDKENSSLTPPELDDGCLVSVEGLTEYCGKYSMDLSFEDNFSYYPIMERKTFTIMDGNIVHENSNAFIRTERTADGLVLKLYGLTKEYTISASTHMCETSNANGTKFSILNEEGTEVGHVYKLDPSVLSCDPMPGVWKSGSNPATSISGDVSFAECLASATTDDSSKNWAELVKTEGSCDAWDDSLDTKDGTFQRQYDGELEPGCTCVFSASFGNIPEKTDVNVATGVATGVAGVIRKAEGDADTPEITNDINDVDRDCMVIITGPIFHSPYAVKFIEGETGVFPRLVAKTVVLKPGDESLSVGNFFEESEDGYRYIEYNTETNKQQVKAKDGTTRDIKLDGFICSGDIKEREPYHYVMDTDNDEMTGVLKRISNISCERVDKLDVRKIAVAVKQGVVCPDTYVLCTYGPSATFITCLSIHYQIG